MAPGGRYMGGGAAPPGAAPPGAPPGGAIMGGCCGACESSCGSAPRGSRNNSLMAGFALRNGQCIYSRLRLSSHAPAHLQKPKANAVSRFHACALAAAIKRLAWGVASKAHLAWRRRESLVLLTRRWRHAASGRRRARSTSRRGRKAGRRVRTTLGQLRRKGSAARSAARRRGETLATHL